MHQNLKPICLALLLAATSTAQAAAPDNIYFFGDSLTDSGAFSGLNGWPAGARWTLGNGELYADVLAESLGLNNVANNPDNPNTSTTGNNYAQGGARSSTQSGNMMGFPDSLDIRDLPQQIDSYLASHQADRNALYVVWSGGNDIPAALANPATAQQSVSSDAATLAAQIARLQQAGGGLVLAPNLPDFAATPAGVYVAIQNYAKATGTDANSNAAIGAAWLILSNASSTDTASSNAIINDALAAAAATLGGPASSAGLQGAYQQLGSSLGSLTTLFNLGTEQGIASHGSNVLRANANLLFKEILASPQLYGLSNTTGSACMPGTSSLTCNSAAIPGIDYLFADDRHPTPAAHRILGDYFLSLLAAPYFAEALGNVPASALASIGDTVDARASSLQHEQRSSGQLGLYSSLAGGKEHGPEDSRHEPQLMTVGLDFQLDPQWSLGLAISQGKTDSNVGRSGGYRARHTVMTATSQYQQGNWWLNADASLGSADIDTERHITLGPGTRTETGNTRSNYHQLRLNGGYQWQLGNWRSGPIAGISLQGGRVSAFSENSLQSTSMRYGEQKLDSKIVHAGWQLSTRLNQLSPYLRLSLQHQLQDAPRTLTTGLHTTSGDFTVPGSAIDRNWLEWQTGATLSLGKGINAFVQLGGSSGRSQSNHTRYQAGLAATF